MYLTADKKQEIFAAHGKDAQDTGTAEGQIALFTYRINHLTEHLKKNRKDFNTERSLVLKATADTCEFTEAEKAIGALGTHGPTPPARSR